MLGALAVYATERADEASTLSLIQETFILNNLSVCQTVIIIAVLPIYFVDRFRIRGVILTFWIVLIFCSGRMCVTPAKVLRDLYMKEYKYNGSARFRTFDEIYLLLF